MADKKLIFMAVNMLVTVLSLAIIIATMFIENQRVKTTAIFVAITILIVQKIIEIKVIKETRKISILILCIIIAATCYFGYRLF